MSEPSPERRLANITITQVQQRLDALSQTYEVLDLRLREFEQVLLDLDDRLRRLAAIEKPNRRHSARPIKPPKPHPRRKAQPYKGHKPPQRRRPIQSRRVLLLSAVLGVAWLLFARNATSPMGVINPRASSQAVADHAQTIQLTSRGTTWLEVQNSSGQILHYGMMKPGQLSFPVPSALRIRAGRPDLIEVRFKKQTRPLGDVGDLDWHHFRLN